MENTLKGRSSVGVNVFIYFRREAFYYIHSKMGMRID